MINFTIIYHYRNTTIDNVMYIRRKINFIEILSKSGIIPFKVRVV